MKASTSANNLVAAEILFTQVMQVELNPV